MNFEWILWKIVTFFHKRYDTNFLNKISKVREKKFVSSWRQADET